MVVTRRRYSVLDCSNDKHLILMAFLEEKTFSVLLVCDKAKIHSSN
jgi:hypothetical protein